MYRISVEGEFSSAHSLRDYPGKCAGIHGHNWKVRLTVRTGKLDSRGLSLDFGSLKALLEDENVDAILCIAGFPTLKTISAAIRGRDKPVVTWVLGEWGGNLFSKVKETGYEAVYPSPERAFRALAALRHYSAERAN